MAKDKIWEKALAKARESDAATGATALGTTIKNAELGDSGNKLYISTPTTSSKKTDSRSQWTAVGGGRKSTTDAGKTATSTGKKTTTSSGKKSTTSTGKKTTASTGKTSTDTDKTSTQKIQKFKNSSWSFDYEADPEKVKATEQKTDGPSIGERLAGMFKSAGLREASGLSEAAGNTMDRTGGTAATDLYQDQLDALDRQISAAQEQLKRTDLSAADRRELQDVLQQAQQQRKVYEDAIRANQNTGSALRETAGQAFTAAEEQDQKNTEGLGALGTSVVDLGTGLIQAGMEGVADRIVPGLGTVTRTASTIGTASRNYRQSTENYDAGKAQTAGALAGAGILAGTVLSNAVGSASIGVLKALGKQNDILPNILASGVAGAGYAAGETGMGEIAKAVTYDDYEPDWSEIGTSLVA